jgi:hypothetical protein
MRRWSIWNRGWTQRTVVLPLFAGLLMVVGLVSCSRTPSNFTGSRDAAEPEEAFPAWFEDVTEAWGIDFVHDPGPVGRLRL